MLTTGSLVSSATAIRVASSWMGLWVQRGPRLCQLAVNASVGGPETGKAQAAFRDNLIGFARESIEVASREVRMGLDKFDAASRPQRDPSTDPFRPYRVKL